ncbi:MAG: chemotaxis protein CheW [Oligoflexales bacterium]|nr:chemotaxis protein CheW [Oligoflexales bacterium]
MANFDLKILCVDDEAAILELYQSAVKNAGFTPILCSSAKAAIQQFREEMQEIVLVISDYRMPELTGFELRNALLPEGLAVPFVIVSSYVTKEMALEALELKIEAFFDKPIDDDGLAKVIEKYSQSRIDAVRENQALESTFIEEANAIVDELDSVLLSLDHDRSNHEKINLVFRGAHTIKGSSGVLSSDIITRYVHKYEDIISAIKKGQLDFNDSVYEVLLKGFDRIKELISAIPDKQLGLFRLEELLPELDLDKQEKLKTNAPQKTTAQSTPVTSAVQKPKESIAVPIEMLEQLSGCSGEITVIRNMVNKLVRTLERNQLGNKDVQHLGELLEEMHKINGTIQTHIVDLRKIPLSGVLKPLPRIIRDLSKDLGKSISLIIEGEKLRVDNSLATECSNSLVHLVRNSADHGIEDIATRKKNGKPECGTVKISCREVGDEIQISISDDGRGIDPEKIKQKALEKELFSAQQLNEMNEQQILGIIFASGFSTAAKVSDVSGRGVGMDMVRSSVEAVGGKILIDSRPGLGSTFHLKLPIPKSVLIITSLLVEAAGRTFALPQDTIQKILRIEPEQFNSMVQMASLGRTLRFADEIFPLIKLSEVLGLSYKDPEKSYKQSTNIEIILLEIDRLRFALEVEGIQDSEEIVVNRIQPCFNPQGAFTGATFMGDGSVGLILDVKGIAELGGIKAHTEKSESSDTSHASGSDLIKLTTANERNFLLFKLNSKAIFGVPLEQVFRLEEFENSNIQHSGAERVIVYRDSVMPLYSFETLLKLNPSRKSTVSEDINSIDNTKMTESKAARIPAIVAKGKIGYMALEVESVVDIAATVEDVSPSVRDRIGVVGNAFIREHNVTILDLPTVLGRELCA